MILVQRETASLIMGSTFFIKFLRILSDPQQHGDAFGEAAGECRTKSHKIKRSMAPVLQLCLMIIPGTGCVNMNETQGGKSQDIPVLPVAFFWV